LRQTIVDRLAQLYHWEVKVEDLVFVPGVVTGFNLACHTLAVPGGGVLVQTPVYTPILNAPSKTYNLASLACSIAVIQNAELRQKYLHSGKGLVSWVNLMGMVAAQAAYQKGQDWLDQLLVYLEANRDYMTKFVQEEIPEVRMGSPEGTYLAWLDCRQAGINRNPYEFFLQKARVALTDGGTFGRGGTGFVRLNFGCPRPMLTEALNRMKEALVHNKG